MRRGKAFILVLCSMLLINTGCAKKEKNLNKETNLSNITLTIFSDANTARHAQALNKAYKQETGVEIEPIILPGTGGEVHRKIDIALMSGEKIDLFHCNAIYFNKVGRAELGLKLNNYIETDIAYNPYTLHGDYLVTHNDGDIYGLPNSAQRWAVFYNKTLFDEQGVAYPEKDWTWDDYIQKAKQLTNQEEEIYGSYMPTYDNILHFKASMAGISGYKEDGTSNFEHSRFKESLIFYKELSSKHHIQPSWTEQRLRNMDSFYFLKGKAAMMVISSWYLSPITDEEIYPRDWEIGIAPLPIFSDVAINKNCTSCGFIVVNKNSNNPQEAYEYAKYVALNRYRHENILPALVGMTKVELAPMFQRASQGTNGSISVQDLAYAYLESGLGISQEKIGGAIGSEYSSILTEEALLYLNNKQSIDKTIDNITERANKVIENTLTR